MNRGYITLNNVHLAGEDDIKLSSFSSFYVAKKSFKQEIAEKINMLLQTKSLSKAMISTFGITHTLPVTTNSCAGDYHVHIDAQTLDVVMTSRGKSIDTGRVIFVGNLTAFIEKFVGETE